MQIFFRNKWKGYSWQKYWRVFSGFYFSYSAGPEKTLLTIEFCNFRWDIYW